MQAPRIVAITATGQVPESELCARLSRLAAWPIEARTRVAVQLRDPELEGRALWELGRRLRDLTRELGVSLLVNDRLDLALSLGADGVHLGRRSVSVADARALWGPGLWVSVSAHSLADIEAAVAGRASAVLLSPVFASPGKGAPLGVAALREARRILDQSPTAPLLIALGGLDGARADEARRAGADGVAAIRADLLAQGNRLLEPAE